MLTPTCSVSTQINSTGLVNEGFDTWRLDDATFLNLLISDLGVNLSVISCVIAVLLLGMALGCHALHSRLFVFSKGVFERRLRAP